MIRLYHNNRDGTLPTSPQDASGPQCLGMGSPSAIRQRRLRRFFITCLGPEYSVSQQGRRTFGVTEKAGLIHPEHASLGCTWIDYDPTGSGSLVDTIWSSTGMPFPRRQGLHLHLPWRSGILPAGWTPARALRLYHNNGNGTFTDVSEKSGSCRPARLSLDCAAADFDGDGGRIFTSRVTLLRGLLFPTRDGTFTEQGLGERSLVE